MTAIMTEMIGVMIAGNDVASVNGKESACAVTTNTINTTNTIAGTMIIDTSAIRGAHETGGADRSDTSRLFPTSIEFL